MYDLIVLGGGPGGYLAAERAAAEGLSVALVEKRFLGGVCLNEGCIPTKTLLNSAKIYDYTKHGEAYGVTVSSSKLDHKAVIARKNEVRDKLVAGIRGALRAGKVKVFEAEGIITGKGNGFTVQAGDEIIEGNNLIIATGSVSVVPPIPGLREAVTSGFAMTNREILDMEELPKKLVVIGGGVIGLEMASYFNSAGCSVTVIEMLPNIAGANDREISDILLKSYTKKGIDFKLGAKVVELDSKSVSYELDGKTVKIPADRVLVSIGRRAASPAGIESIGVALTRGSIITDEFCKTNIPGVYAAGDVNGKSMLAHTAYREAEVAVNNIVGKADRVRYNAIPAVIYTNPEVAGVGETEESAKSRGIKYKKSVVSMMFSGRYMAENTEYDGICKVLADEKTDRIIGVHMIGSYASEVIMSAAMMVELEMRIRDVKQMVFPHPTVAEIIREAIFKFK
ncbi:MAG: dihydrolipoyl dehydrogenase [Clostridia bacterium]